MGSMDKFPLGILPEKEYFEVDSGLRYPLSPVQHAIYVAQMLDPRSTLYNMGMTFRISGNLDTRRFENAWNQTVLNSDALRLRLYKSKDAVNQFSENLAVDLVHVDISSTEDNETCLNEWIQEDLCIPMDIHGPLVGSMLVKLSENDWIWYCKLHHIITDAASYIAIWDQLTHYYENPDSDKTLVCGSFRMYCTETYCTESSELSGTSESDTSDHYWHSKDLPPSLTYYGSRLSYTSSEAQRFSDFFDSDCNRQMNDLLRLPEVRSFSSHIAKFQVLLTTFFILLYRITGQGSLAIATTVPNRSSPEYRTTPGLFVELLPLCIDINGDDTYKTVLDKVKSEFLLLMKQSKAGASTVRSFREVSAVINYVPFSISKLDDLNVEADWLHSGHMDRQHAIRLHVTDWNQTESLNLALETNSGCFGKEKTKETVNHFLRIYEGFVDDLNLPISGIPLCVGHGASYQTSDNRPTLENPKEPETSNLMVERFIKVATEHSLDPAISEGSVSLTYQTVLERVSSVADCLSEHGVGPWSRVAIILPRSMSVPISLFAVLKAGATYIPIDYETPAFRIRKLFELASIDAVITDSELYMEFKDSSLVVVNTDDGGKVVGDNRKLVSKENTVSDEDKIEAPAYILFTSGSTGTPKGVVVSRKAMANYCFWAANYYCRGQSCTFPFFTPVGFDLTITSLFVPWLTGGQIRVYKKMSSVIDNSLAAILSENRVDIIKLTPSHLATLKAANLCDSRVSQLIVGGEDLKASLAREVAESFGQSVLIHNEYGPTEATVGCIVHRFDPENDITASVPIGCTVAGMSSVILNESFQLQPNGVSGELYLSGPSLADGYLDPEASKIGFVTLPHLGGNRFYRTGDIARIDQNGSMVFLGRSDHQIKHRGARVEIAEIEQAALQHDLLMDCVVVLREPKKREIVKAETHCAKCGISSRFPDVEFNTKKICNLCVDFDHYQERASVYFKEHTELEKLADRLKGKSERYDCMMLLSGGKDSTYALGVLADLGLKILAYTLDNGYLSLEAKENIKRVCASLSVDHEFAKTPAMREIFADSLEQFSNVCNGCFKTIYTLSLKRADELNIGAIFTGLSRGQFFETRLSKELFIENEIRSVEIDEIVLNARIAYHKTPDAVTRSIDCSHLDDRAIFERVTFYDFYRYCDVDLDELYDYLKQRLPWIRPRDTGRSTNCLINDVGIYVHQLEKGYHNYSLPYSWDVRLGHKQRDASLEELNDELDIDDIERILDEVGYQPQELADKGKKLVLYFTASSEVDLDSVQHHLSTQLPLWMVPDSYMQLDELPLSQNGKVDRLALPLMVQSLNDFSGNYLPPTNDWERSLCGLWAEELNLDRVGIQDNFFELGGDSLAAIRITAKVNELGYSYSGTALFENPTVLQFAAQSVESKALRGVMKKAKPFASVDKSNLAKLSNMLNKSQE